MANAVIVQVLAERVDRRAAGCRFVDTFLPRESVVALDPDHVEYLEVNQKQVHLGSGNVLVLADADFASVYAIKTGNLSAGGM